MTTPVPPQNMTALALANTVRRARVELKRRIGRGEITVAEVVAPRPVPRELLAMPVIELLRAQPGWGLKRSQRLMWRLAIGEARRLGELTDRQRAKLRFALEGGAVPDQRLLAP
jgi:hypothetical protein